MPDFLKIKKPLILANCRQYKGPKLYNPKNIAGYSTAAPAKKFRRHFPATKFSMRYSANAMSGSSTRVILYWIPGRITSGLSREYTCK